MIDKITWALRVNKARSALNKLRQPLHAVSSLLGICCAALLGTAPGSAADRVKVCMLPLENLSGQTNAEHWAQSLEALIEGRLSCSTLIHLLPESSVSFGIRELKLGPGQSITQDQVRQVAKTIEARWAVWGTYEEDGKNVRIAVQALNVSKGKPSKILNYSSQDHCAAAFEVSQRILDVLGIALTAEQERRSKRLLPNCPEAFELTSRGMWALNKQKSVPLALTSLEKAAVLDPDYFPPQIMLARCRFLSGDLDSAERAAYQAVKADAESASVHRELSVIFSLRGSNTLAQVEALKAVELDPDEPSGYLGLGHCYRDQGKLAEALSTLRKGERAGPYDAQIHAELANIYVRLGDHASAARELNAVKRYDDLTEPFVQNSVAVIYDFLHDVPEAVSHYEAFLAWAESAGVAEAELRTARQRLAYWKPTLTPHFIAASPPQAFSRQALEKILNERLTARECLLVSNPLRDSSKLKKWAKELEGSSATQQEKARRLYDGLARHVDINTAAGRRTAIETFNEWKNPGASFTCQEYALLYVVLARAVGLNAYFVLVEKDYRGSTVSHACAGVFIDGKALLVDPAYRWLGIPHEQVRFLNDLEVISIYLTQLDDVLKRKAAVKLCPECAFAQFNLAIFLADHGAIQESRAPLEAGLKLEPESWFAFYARGAVECEAREWNASVEHLQRCLEINPGFPLAHYVLANSLFGEKRLADARDEYRAFLQTEKDSGLAARARDQIARINELLGE